MYERFGSLVDPATQTVTFRLFVPDGERAPSQYDGGGLPRLTSVAVLGSFQPVPWDRASALPMPPSDFIDPDSHILKGTVYSSSLKLPAGFYEYKYLVTFENAEPRLLTDPCARYGGRKNQDSGFVIGGTDTAVHPLPTPRLPYADLRIYEMMIDDFTANYKSDKQCPFEAVVDKLDDLVDLGINAIEFMPWTAWVYPDDASSHDFSWGYNPAQYFSVAHKYTDDPTSDTDKLVHLKHLVNECHRRGIHVIMDGVFNHAEALPPDRGFPYYWLYQEPADSPYVGDFAEHAFFQDLDYANQCTLEYIRDACIYWIEVFKIDGIRLDNTLGLYKPDDRGHGLPKLLSELRGYLSRTANKNFAFVMEHSWDYAAIDVVNKVGATSCWLDPYRSQSMSYLGDRPAGKPQIESSMMRMLNSGLNYGTGRAATIYIENHDHRRFMLKAGGRPFWFLTQPYVIALFTSSGATLVYNGQEYGADNDMPEDGNLRVVPRPLDWKTLQQDPGPAIRALYKTMMAIRSAHPGLRSPNFYPDKWDENTTSFDPDGYGIDRDKNLVVYHRWGSDAAGKTEYFYVALNFSADAQSVSFAVPFNGAWSELLSAGTATAVDGRLNVQLTSNWGAIFFRAV